MFPPGIKSLLDVFETYWSAGVWVFLASLLVSLLATPAFRWLALRTGVYDQPDQAVKIHSRPIPYLGGCAIWLGWMVGIVLYHLIRGESFTLSHVALLVAGLVAFLTGLIDDLKDIRPWQKIMGQALAGAILWAGGIRWLAYPHVEGISIFEMPEDSWLVFVVCIAMHFLVIIGATNATNLVDGLDGLCSGVAAIVSMGFLLLATSLSAWGNPDWVRFPVTYEFAPLIVIVAFALTGAAVGFLPYNFNPARIFMGDAGSVFIGYVLALMMIMFASRFGMVKWFVGALFIFGLPIFDTGVAMVRRMVNRRPIMMPDRSHLYNQLVDRLGLSVRATVAVLYSLSAILAAAGLLVLYMPGRYATLIYVVAGAALLVVVWRLGFLRMTPEERQAADRYLDRKRGRT